MIFFYISASKIENLKNLKIDKEIIFLFSSLDSLYSDGEAISLHSSHDKSTGDSKI